MEIANIKRLQLNDEPVNEYAQTWRDVVETINGHAVEIMCDEPNLSSGINLRIVSYSRHVT
jgi:hypothetical protein